MIIKHSETPESDCRRLAARTSNTPSRSSGSPSAEEGLRRAVRSPFTGLGVLALALIPPSIVLAAGSDSADLQEIVVTARMRAENLIDVPISTSVFSTKEINDARIKNPIDFIAQSPNVSLVLSQNAGTSFMTIRGISQVRNGESPVAVVVDGVQIVDPAQFTQGTGRRPAD